MERNYGNGNTIEALPFWKTMTDDYDGLRYFSNELNRILTNLGMVGGDSDHKFWKSNDVKIPPKPTEEWGDHVLKILPQKATLTNR